MKFFLYLFLVICVVLSPLAFSVLFQFLKHLSHHEKIPRREYPSEWVNRNLILKLIYDFPKAFVTDLFTLNPDFFPFDKCGLVLFEGKQGSGKSVGAVYYINMLKKMFPKCKVMSNISLSLADTRLEEWQDIVFTSNGEYGQIVFLDEIQNYFNSMDSKDFPPEMLGEICQQRKQRKTIIGTVQVFGRVAKPIREQVSLLVRPFTLFGCLTVLNCYEPKCDDDARLTSLRRVHTYVFTHTPELRNAYDTFEIVQRHALTGFKPKDERLTVDPPAPVAPVQKKRHFLKK